MNDMNIISLPASESFRPQQALASAMELDPSDVIIIGYVNGELMMRSSKMTCAEALFLLERGKSWALSGGRE